MSLPAEADQPAPPADSLDGASLFLDFDGTLVSLAERPDGVRVDAALRGLMGRLHEKLDGRLALVSGRAAAQVRHLFGQPRFTVAGGHGLEFHYPDGRAIMAARPAGLDEALEAMHALARGWPGVLVEEKPLGAALHFRQNPAAQAACIAIAEDMAKRHGLKVQTGKMMIEARADAGDKGSAIRELMAEPPFRGTRPLFVGDDDTDEPGFAAAAALGGAGIIVGCRHPTAARYRLADVAEVLLWLDAVSKP